MDWPQPRERAHGLTRRLAGLDELPSGACFNSTTCAPNFNRRLNAATHEKQMDAPGLRLHPLKGKSQGHWAVDVDENFRVVSHFEGGHAVGMDYGDYH